VKPLGAPPRSRALLVERVATIVGIAVFAVLLWGGYVRDWGWTGFGENDRLWDWLNLMLLPLALGLLPVWLARRDRLDARRRRLMGGALAGFVVLVVAGYLVPLVWTGFEGNTLWDWLSLLVLPAAAATIVFWRDGRRVLQRHHRLALALVAAALLITVLGGYLLDWTWTGFRGTTLWDWLQLLIAPLVLPTVLLPVAAAWIAAEEQRDQQAAAGLDAPASPDIPPGARSGLRVLGALTTGGLVAVIALAHHPSASSHASARKPAPATTPCDDPAVSTVVADATAGVVRLGQRFYACTSSGQPVLLGAAGRRGGPAQFRLAAHRLVFAQDRCPAARSCTSTVMTLRLGSAAGPFVRLRWPSTGGVAGLYVGPRATVAVMLRGRCAPVAPCGSARLYVQDARGTRLVATGPGLDARSLAGAGATVYWRDGGRAQSHVLAF
jgi:hypothetical protein